MEFKNKIKQPCRKKICGYQRPEDGERILDKGGKRYKLLVLRYICTRDVTWNMMTIVNTDVLPTIGIVANC